MSLSTVLSAVVSGAFLASPHLILWGCCCVALVAYVTAALCPALSHQQDSRHRVFAPHAQEAQHNSHRAARAAWGIGWLAQGAAIGVDMAGVGSTLGGARFGFATALSVTVWVVLLIYAIESRWFSIPGPRKPLALLGALAVMLSAMFPGEFRALVHSPWAPVHWALGLASYGLFGAAVLHAAMLDAAERALRLKKLAGGMPLLALERLTFQFVAAGFVLLSATLVLGWWFAHPWRWDHKTVFSIMGWAVFGLLLLGRKTLGWRGRHAIGWLYAGALMLLLAYVGSRFMLGVVLNRPLP
jgi:ABC-type uncharacterized transport system permease subunit